MRNPGDRRVRRARWEHEGARPPSRAHLQGLRDFDVDNDPRHEHDMAFFELDGERYFCKFDYYAPDMQHGADDPSDIEKTMRLKIDRWRNPTLLVGIGLLRFDRLCKNHP